MGSCHSARQGGDHMAWPCTSDTTLPCNVLEGLDPDLQ